MSEEIVASSIYRDQDHIALSNAYAMITLWNISDAKVKHKVCGYNDMQSSKNTNHLHELHLYDAYQMDHALQYFQHDSLFDHLLLSIDAASAAALQNL